MAHVNGKSDPAPYIVLRAPPILQREQHEKWLENRCSELRNEGYSFFRASFPDDAPDLLYLEGWVLRPEELGPCPWETEAPRKVLRPTISAKSKSDLVLLDGSEVPANGSHVRKRADGQQNSYVVFSDRKLAATPLVRPVQYKIRHLACLSVTEMHEKMAQTLARDPSFYKAFFCIKCRAHFKIGRDGEFLWHNSDQKVGT